MERSSGAVRTACDIQIYGRRGGGGRPKPTWKELTEKEWREWKLMTVDPRDRSTWRSAMRAVSSYMEGGPLMWMMPIHLHINKKSDYSIMILSKVGSLHAS